MVTPSNGISVAAPGESGRTNAPMLATRRQSPVGDVVTKEEERPAPIFRRAQVGLARRHGVWLPSAGPVGDGQAARRSPTTRHQES